MQTVIYEPLHHKYRPQTFAELVGQAAIATTLTNALHASRIAPAYLFTGARGTGKTSSARILAKSLNCLQSEAPTEVPCGTCEVCRAIAAGMALDVIEIDAASNTGVDNIRELIERAQFAPVQCRYKVYIIDEVHMLSTAAFNALLKTLEEPPERVVFILATTDPQRVLPTIISRCQRFDFRRIPLADMVGHLRTIADRERIPITDEAITLVAQLAQGGLRDAESLLDQLSLLSGDIAAEQVWDLVGSVPERDLLELLIAIVQDDPQQVLDSTRRLMDRGREPLIVLQNLASFYRDLLIAKTAPERSDLVAVTPLTWEQLCQWAHQLELTTILAGQQHLRNGETQLKSTTQPRLWLEILLMGLLPSALPSSASTIATSPLSTLRPQPSRDAASPVSPKPPSVVEGEETGRAYAPVNEPALPNATIPSLPTAQPVAAVEPSKHDAPDPTQSLNSDPTESSTHATADLLQIWQSVLEQITPPSTQMLLRQQGRLLKLSHTDAHIGITAQWHKNVKQRLPNLSTAFTKALKRSVQVHLETVSPTDVKEAGYTPSSHLSRPDNPTLNNHELVPPSDEPLNQPDGSRANINEPAAEPDFVAPTVPYPSELLSPILDWQEDETTKAAKQLAEFFAGQVVDLDSRTTIPSGISYDSAHLKQESSSATWEDSEDEPDDDDDVPF